MVCRVCFAVNVKMFFIQNHQLLEMYEKLSCAKLNAAERPQGVCYICCSLLLRCCRFSEMARRSEQILTDILDQGIEVAQETILIVLPREVDNVINLSEGPMQLVALDDCESIKISAITIDEEPLVVKQENTISLEDQHFTEQISLHEDNIMDNSGNELQSSFIKADDIMDDSRNEQQSSFFTKHLSQIHNEDKLNVNTSHSNTNRKRQSVQQFQPEKRQYTCDQCNIKYISKRCLVTHMQIHTGEKPYKCEQCEKRFTQNYHLTRHMRIHTGLKPYKCKHCEKRFAQNHGLTSHMRIHTGLKPYKCKQCDKEFSHASNLTKHNMRIHTRLKLYKCKQCNKEFSFESYLTKHMRIHNGLKLYQCKQCDKEFSYASNLTKHMRIHTGLKPYKCKLCDKRFALKGNLITHMRIHTR